MNETIFCICYCADRAKVSLIYIDINNEIASLTLLCYIHDMDQSRDVPSIVLFILNTYAKVDDDEESIPIIAP